MQKVVDERTAYLDTCVVSGLARNDMLPADSESMVLTLSASDAESLRFVTSSDVLDEFSQIPQAHRTPHLATSHLLQQVRALLEPSFTRLDLWGGPGSNPDRTV